MLFDQVRQLATLDPLTGVANRRRVLEAAEQRFARADPAGGDLSVIMIDIDHFKIINDTRGHQAGDDVIKEVAHRLRSVLRHDDLLGRYGGEEFLITVTADHAGADQLAELLRAVAATPVPTLVGPIAVTTSVGISHIRTGDTDLATVVGRADQALYAAKEQGRNRVVAI